MPTGDVVLTEGAQLVAAGVLTLARELGVCWWTIMNAVVEHGTPLVDVTTPCPEVENLWVEELILQSYLDAGRARST